MGYETIYAKIKRKHIEKNIFLHFFDKKVC